jgi:tetratricopeptide (TPR) repeat protein
LADAPDLGLDRVWKFVPETVVSKIPVLAKWRSKSAETHVIAAVMAAEKQDYQTAISEFKQAIELEPTSRDYLYKLGKAYFDADNLSEAEICFRKALLIDFYNSDSLKGLAYTLHRLGKFAEAIYCYFR